MQDLTKIQADISTAIQNGTQWTVINFDCTRDELDEWRVTASSILYDLEHTKKGMETQQADISEAYKKNVEDWTEIMLKENHQANGNGRIGHPNGNGREGHPNRGKGCGGP